jgi:peptidoglycan/xylan/chitin deacetylase (PgdA/CDA1 family)
VERAIIKPLPIPDTRPPPRSAPESATSKIANAPGRSIRRVALPDGQKFIALTFDLCEQATEKTGYDGAIVDYLRAQQIKATFFAGGKWMRSHPQRTMQLMADPLFEIGNHAWTHGNLRVMRGEEMRNQIVWTQAQYELLWEDLKKSRCAINAGIKEMNLIPRLPGIFRFPYGACSAESLQATAQLDLDAIQWNIVTADSARGQTVQAIADTILKSVTPGSIVIAHANGRGRHTADALAIVVPELKRRGYKFATVSELLVRGKPVAEDTCYERKPSANKHYDRLFGNGTGL